MNELRELFKLAGDAGAVIVLALSAWGIFRSIQAMVVVWGTVAKERNAIDAERNAIDDKLAIAQVQSAAILDRLVTGQEQTKTLISAKAQESRLAHGTTQQYVEEIKTSLRGASEQMQSVVQRGDHQRRAIADSVLTNGEKLDEIRALLKTAVSKIDDHNADKEVVTMLGVVAQKLDACLVARHTHEQPKSGENVSDTKADKEA